MTSIGKRIPLVASIAFHTRREKELSIDEQAVRPPMRQNRCAAFSSQIVLNVGAHDGLEVRVRG